MKYVKYLVNTLIALALVFMVAYSRGVFSAAEPADRVKAASDGFAIGAFMYLAVGGLLLVASTDFFDIFSYGIRRVGHYFIPGLISDSEGKFADYKAERAERRSEKKTNWFLLLLGAEFLLISGILSIIWYKL